MRPGWNRLENQRCLYPRDYCDEPSEFGHVRHARFHVPEGGREIDAWMAQQQHLLIVEWQARGRRPTTRDLHRHLGISKQLMSRNANGYRWIGMLEARGLEALPR